MTVYHTFFCTKYIIHLSLKKKHITCS